MLSPDGSQIVIATGNVDDAQLQLRRLDSTEANTLTGGGTYNPFFSPDGAWVGFALTNSLMKVPATGGTPLKIAEVSRSRGSDWGEGGRIVFAPDPNSGLMIVSADGGEVTEITTLDETTGERTHRWPQILPGGRYVLFTAHTEQAGGFDAATLKIVDLESGEQTVVYRGGYYGRYARSGHLLFVNAGTLFAAPFDLDNLEIIGSTVPVAEDVADDPGSGGAQYAVSSNGILVHRRGTSGPGTYPAVWLSRDNETSNLLTEPRTYVEARVSPDGQRLAMTELNADNWDVWVYDLERGTRTRLTFDDGIEGPAVWSPDGSELIYSSDQDGSDDLYRKPADGSDDGVQLTHEDLQIYVSDWSRDGRHVLALRIGQRGRREGLAEWLRPRLHRPRGRRRRSCRFSPPRSRNPRRPSRPTAVWVAYQSNESGRSRSVRAARSRQAGGRWQVSDEGGAYARWAQATATSFTTARTRAIMAVSPCRALGRRLQCASRPRLDRLGQLHRRPRRCIDRRHRPSPTTMSVRTAASSCSRAAPTRHRTSSSRASW